MLSLMHPEPTPLPSTSPINEEHVLILHESAARFAKLQKAIKYASFNGSTMLCFGGLSLLTGIGDVASMSIGAALVGAGVLELRHRSALRSLEVSALPRLALNQVFVAVAVFAYCAYQAFFPAESEIAGRIGGDAGGIDVEGITKSIQMLSFFAYLGVGGLTVLFQLFAAWYYLAKRPHLERYLRESPAWVHELQRRGLLKAA